MVGCYPKTIRHNRVGLIHWQLLSTISLFVFLALKFEYYTFCFALSTAKRSFVKFLQWNTHLHFGLITSPDTTSTPSTSSSQKFEGKNILCFIFFLLGMKFCLYPFRYHIGLSLADTLAQMRFTFNLTGSVSM